MCTQHWLVECNELHKRALMLRAFCAFTLTSVHSGLLYIAVYTAGCCQLFFERVQFGFLQGIKFSYDKTTSILKLTGTYSMSK
jgi:hypothetical protein